MYHSMYADASRGSQLACAVASLQAKLNSNLRVHCFMKHEFAADLSANFVSACACVKYYCKSVAYSWFVNCKEPGREAFLESQ